MGRTVTFNGTNLVTGTGLVYLSFSETLPTPKTSFVSVPYGSDIDLTEALGSVTYGTGTHVLTFLAYGATEAQRLSKVSAAVKLMHGKRASYSLSWQPNATYTGRAKVDVTHLFENADLLTVTITRDVRSGEMT